jgi:acyl phosphate:glycerol-3-phosphate acyltransferase
MSCVFASVSAFVFGYLCGSIPFGIILTRLAGTKDLRAIGSGNIGATNVLRTGRKDLAALTLLLDAMKGTLAVLVVADLWPTVDVEIPAALCAGLGAFLGHVFPVWLRFKGGKGVATFLGCLFGLQWQAGLAFVLIWIGVAAATRYSSAAALSASAMTPFALLALGQGQKAVLFFWLALILWIMHRANIMRLASGTESKIGQAT